MTSSYLLIDYHTRVRGRYKVKYKAEIQDTMRTKFILSFDDKNGNQMKHYNIQCILDYTDIYKKKDKIIMFLVVTT